MKLSCPEPPTAEQIMSLQGGRWPTSATRRGKDLAVTMHIASTDVVGALIRAVNVVLDQVAGEVSHAEVTATEEDVPTARAGRLPRRRSRPQTPRPRRP
jgi:hypothetical protein